MKPQSHPFDRAQLLFLAATVIWAAVMIDTGDIAWPLAVWVGTALAPLVLHRGRHRDQQASTD